MGTPTKKLKLSAASSRSPSGAVPPAWQTEQIGVKIFSWIDCRSAESGGGGLPPGTSGRPLASKPWPLPAHAATNNTPSATALRQGKEGADRGEFLVKSSKPSPRDIHHRNGEECRRKGFPSNRARRSESLSKMVSEVAAVAIDL